MYTQVNPNQNKNINNIIGRLNRNKIGDKKSSSKSLKAMGLSADQAWCINYNMPTKARR
jgi:hypothetical protein